MNTEQKLRELIRENIGLLSEATVNEKIELLTINEGQFSWMTQDDGEQIGSEKQNTITVYMHDNEGSSWKEIDYEGYGVFGGLDYYSLLAKMNGYPEEDRGDGIDLAFGKKKPKNSKKVLFPALTSGKKLKSNHDFTKEPESDPNQSWDSSYYNESLITEAKGKLKDLAKDLAELDKGNKGMTWIYRIRVDQEYSKAAKGNIVVAKVTGRAGDSTPKSYVNKLLKGLGFKPKFFTKNNLGDFHEYIWHLPQFETSDQYEYAFTGDLNYDRYPDTVY
jgi:hypothetical protein